MGENGIFIEIANAISMTVSIANSFLLLTHMYRFRSARILRVTAGYYLFSIWAMLTAMQVIYTGGRLLVGNDLVLFLMILFFISTQLIIVANRPLVSRADFLVGAALDIGWVVIGILVAEIILGDTGVIGVSYTQSVPVVAINRWILPLFVVRGGILLYLILQTARNFVLEEKLGLVKQLMTTIRGVGVSAALLMFFSSLLISSSEWYPRAFVLTRILIQVVVMAFFTLISVNRMEVVGALANVNVLFVRNDVHFTLVGFGSVGLEMYFQQGFDFYTERDEREAKLMTLGLNSLASLGRGKEYIEGSSIIPLLEDREYTGLVLSGWAQDKIQNDPRLNGRTYLSLLIFIERKADWLFSDRVRWEKEFLNLLQSRDDVSVLTQTVMKRFIKTQMVLTWLRGRI